MISETFLANAQRTVLSVDDSSDKLELISIVMRDAGYRVVTATDGPAAFLIAKQELPDLIISDVSMPGMDGIELCRQVRADENLRNVPIMLITGLYRDTETLARGLAAGADEYLEQPFDPGRLVARATRLIERKLTDEPLATLASIVENSEEAIIGQRLDGTITSWNYGAERMYGYSAAEALGQSIYSLTVPAEHQDELQGIVNGISRGGRSNRFLSGRRRKDGEIIDVSMTIAPIKDAQGRLTGASAIARDVTEANRADAERNRLIVELQEALAEVKTLRGILPICMHCKKIRDEEGAWTQLELYISQHTDADFSHGLCEPCAHTMYPEIYDKTRTE
jgi:PAS domain S-box-containing protein